MRVAENLNLALRELLAGNPNAYIFGEDIIDPYGGAFKVTRGLSERFPDRVLSTPLSEGGIVGVAAGLALAGDTAVAEIMFGDFVGLAFDQIANFASKSVSMYGHPQSLRLLVRCPTGGGRGYGPTHSQSLQKHFIGFPGLSLFEVSPFHDNRAYLPQILSHGEPAILFEDKVMYGEQMFFDGTVDDLFSYDIVGSDVARVFVQDPDTFDCVLICPGGVSHRALSAVRRLLLQEEIACQILVPYRLYPFDLTPLLPALRRASLVCVAEESTAGGTWGAEVAERIYRALFGELRRPIRLVSSLDSIIPAATHLERAVLLQDDTIRQAIAESVRD
jgi:pyruvate/2-oxoglutarate/acetoin dehydrogenase E1 component